MNKILIHPAFKLDNHSFKTVADFLQYTAVNYKDSYKFLAELFNDSSYITAHTSGSTGMPKAIQIEKQRLINSAVKTIDFFDLPPETKALVNLSSGFIAGKMMWVRALVGGWHLWTTEPKTESIRKILEKQKFDFGAMVPLQVYQNIDVISKIDKLIIGGGVVSDNLQRKLMTLSNKIFVTYGMTETITHIAVKPLNKLAALNFYEKKEREGSYKVLKDIRIFQDNRDCLVIEAPDISDQQIITNDIVKIVDNQNFIWLGRFDNVINSGGIKMIPEQIEQKINKHLQATFIISAIPDDKLGEVPVLVIEGESQVVDLERLKQVLHKYEVPKKIFYLETIPKTESDKVKRNEVKEIISGFKV